MRTAIRRGPFCGPLPSLAGFSLIENMVALAIFAIGIMAVVYMLMNGVGRSRTSQSLTQAYVAMQEIVGMIRADGAEALSYNGVQTGSTTTWPSAQVPREDIATWVQSLLYLPGSPGTHGGTGEIAVQSAVPGSVNCPCQATIVINWGRGKSYQVTTYVDY